MEGMIMDSEQFDGLVRSFGQTRSRRQALRTLAGVAAGAVALGGAAAVEAGPENRCKNGKELCGKGKNACVDKQTDANNCGGCGNACPTDKPACSGGTCQCLPTSPLTPCPATCTSIGPCAGCCGGFCQEGGFCSN
jgi:hypothetical protein